MALEDGVWSHNASYTPERAARPSTVALWRKIETAEDPVWTERYHHSDPAQKAFGGRVELLLKSGERLVEELAVADAHPAGAKPFAREDYLGKFNDLTDGIVDGAESSRFVALCERLGDLAPEEMLGLNPVAQPEAISVTERNHEGIF